MENEVPTMATIPTLTGLLATIEAIPETPENYRALREARDAAKKLKDASPRTLGYIVVDRSGIMVGGQHKYSESAQADADEWTEDCKAGGVDWDYRVVELTERAA
jgi:hypothetical protein